MIVRYLDWEAMIVSLNYGFRRAKWKIRRARVALEKGTTLS